MSPCGCCGSPCSERAAAALRSVKRTSNRSILMSCCTRRSRSAGRFSRSMFRAVFVSASTWAVRCPVRTVISKRKLPSSGGLKRETQTAIAVAHRFERLRHALHEALTFGSAGCGFPAWRRAVSSFGRHRSRLAPSTLCRCRLRRARACSIRAPIPRRSRRPPSPAAAPLPATLLPQLRSGHSARRRSEIVRQRRPPFADSTRPFATRPAWRYPQVSPPEPSRLRCSPSPPPTSRPTSRRSGPRTCRA